MGYGSTASRPILQWTTYSLYNSCDIAWQTRHLFFDGNHIPKDRVTNLALVCQKSNRRWAPVVLGQTYNRRLRDKFECRVIIKVTDTLRSCDVAWQKGHSKKNSLNFPKDCVTNLTLVCPKWAYRPSSFVHRPSSIVHRLSSRIQRLGFSPCPYIGLIVSSICVGFFAVSKLNIYITLYWESNAFVQLNCLEHKRGRLLQFCVSARPITEVNLLR